MATYCDRCGEYLDTSRGLYDGTEDHCQECEDKARAFLARLARSGDNFHLDDDPREFFGALKGEILADAVYACRTILGEDTTWQHYADHTFRDGAPDTEGEEPERRRYTFVVEHIYHVEAESLEAARRAFASRACGSFDFEDVTSIEDEAGEPVSE